LLERLMAEDPETGVHRESVEDTAIWSAVHPDTPLALASIPLRSGDRVMGVLVLGRPEDAPFAPDELRFLESAAPVVAIALRTVRLHRANEWALAQSVRLQEVASLAGHGLSSVAGSVAELARTMVNATGVACWAFDDEGRVIASAVRGDGRAAGILPWSGRSALRGWDDPPREAINSRRRPGAWTLLPLWYGDRMVGAIGTLRPLNALEDLGSATIDFTRHAAIAMENARLAEETRGRIQTLEAIAAFGSLDLAHRDEALTGLGGLIADALSHVHGALWVLQGSVLVDVSSARPARIRVASPQRLLEWIASGGTSRELRRLFRGGGGAERLLAPVLVGDDLAGVVAAGGREATVETRRLMSVLAAQAGVVLARLDLVARLDREAKTMDAVLSNSPVGVVLESEAGRIAFANAAIERLYGVTESSLVGQRLDAIYRRSGAQLVEEVEVGPHTVVEIRLKDLVVEVRRVVIPGSGDRSERVLTLHEDVTQERRLQEAKDLMLRAIGHEVRSPAAAMRGTIASLLQWHEVMDAQQRQGLMESAYEQSQRLLALVESQLLISQLETGNFRPNAEQVALRRAMEDTMGVLRHRYAERAEAVDVQLAPVLSAASCDATHLGQVLINVVGNALEYTRATRIVVSAREVDGWLELTVRDNGGGVPPDRVDTLFSKLTPAGQKRARGGLGIGLYLCRLVVERSFGGHIWLDQTGPGGTTFKFTVPAAMAGVRAIAQ
ncbi:MAG TPA: ATP-binding protein, partial [Candidatus Dormibacteraeota bacterium]|nr:ATP-binding protein [Candidatus Dormibacteraeota bacterium]